jgi:hypothetical protein
MRHHQSQAALGRMLVDKIRGSESESQAWSALENLALLQQANDDADNRTMPRLTLLRCEKCGRSKAHTVERIDGLLTWTCTRCGSVVKQPPARRAA